MKHNRHSIRLRSWDYSSGGFYFVTICTYQRECLFGEVDKGKVNLSKEGRIVREVWKSLPEHHSVSLDAFQIMPNHIHGVIVIRGRRGVARNALNEKQGVTRYAPTRIKNNVFSQISPSSASISVIIRSFKSECTKQIRRAYKNQYLYIWQRNFYEHIIRNEIELEKIRKYIKGNPLRWDEDRNNPENLKLGS